MTDGSVRASRALAWSGIVAPVLFAAGAIMVSSAPGGGSGTTLKDFADFYSSSGKRSVVLIGAYVLTIGCLAMVCFFTALHRRIAVGGDDLLAEVGHKSALLGLAVIAVSGALLGAPAAVQTYGDGKFVGVSVAHAFAEAGFCALLVPGMLGVTVGVFTLARAGRRTGSIPGWLGIAGMVTAVLLLASLLWLPMMLFPIWVLIVGVATFRKTPASV
jgi:hypothetical protein